MNKEKVTLHIDKDRVLYAHKADGTEYRLNKRLRPAWKN